MTDCLKIVCYACWSQNCGRFERFENENFLGSLRAYSRPQSHPEPPRATPPGRGAGAGVGSGGLSHEELELSDMGSVRLNVRLNALF